MDEEYDKKTSAYLTHELRAPLTSIACALGLLREQHESGGSEQDKQLLDVALRNCRRLNRLIDDIMDVSRDTGRKHEARLRPLRSGPARSRHGGLA